MLRAHARTVPASRPRRALALLVVLLVLASGATTLRPRPADAAVPSAFMDLTFGGHFHNIGMTDRRWGPLQMAGGVGYIGACSCQITSMAAMLGMYTGMPALDPQWGIGLSQPLFPSTVVDSSWLVSDIWRRRIVWETHLEPIFSPHYLDTYLMQTGNYEGGPACGAPPNTWALEWVADPLHLPTGPNQSIQLGPSGMGIDYQNGFPRDLVLDRLANNQPTIVGRHIAKDDGGFRRHANIVVGYDPSTDRFRWVDPVQDTGDFGYGIWGDTAEANEDYAEWESSIVTTIITYPVMQPQQHLAMNRQDSSGGDLRAVAAVEGVDAPRAEIELGAVLPDGTPVGYEPATGEHHQFRGHYDYAVYPDTPVDDPDASIADSDLLQGLLTTDVDPGVVRTRIVGTSTGTYEVLIHDVRAAGAQDQTLAVASGTIAAGEEVKHEVTYAEDGSAVAVEVDDFSPEIIVAPIDGVATEPVALDASDSFDADGTITGVAWDFGDGTTGTGTTPTHTWSKPGSYEVTVTVTSDNRVTRSETVTATIAATETDAPDITVDVDPAGADDGWTTADEVTVTAGATDDGAGVEALTVTATGADEQPPVTTDGSAAQVVVDAEGITSVVAEARDRMDNVAGSDTVSVQIDRTAPTASVGQPAGTTVPALRFLTGRASDELSGVDHVEVLLRRADGRTWDGDGWSDGDHWLDADGEAGWWLTSGLPAGADLPDGDYQVQARATDVAGNLGEASAAATVTVAAGSGGGGGGASVEELQPAIQSGTTSEGNAVSDAGDAVGYAGGLDLNRDVANRWAAGTSAPTALPPLPTRVGAQALDISEDGDTVVGWSKSDIGLVRATAWVDGQAVDLGSVVGGISQANAVNDAGYAVGSSAIVAGRGQSRAAEFEDGFARFLPDLGGDSSTALAVNEAGIAVGYAVPPASTIHRAFRTDGETAVALGTPGQFSSANDINEAGQIAGSDGGDAVVWDDGGTHVLGAGSALGINDAGDVVGSRTDFETGERFAMLWRGGEAIDLNSLLPPASGWLLEQAEDIDGSGDVIVGTGTYLGSQRGFRLHLPGSGGGGGGGGGDTTAPASTASFLPAEAASGWVNTAVEVAITAADAGSGVDRIEVAGHDPVGGPTRTVVVDADGEHELAWMAIDVAGNVEPVRTATVRIDRTAPTATADLPPVPASGWFQGPVDVVVGGADTGGSGLGDLAVTVDDGAATSGPARTVTVEGDGTHTVAVVPADRAGNAGAEVTVSVAVDGTDPTVHVGLEEGASVRAGTLASFLASDAGSGVGDVVAWVTDSEGRRRIHAGEPLTNPGPVTIEVEATDVAGNTATASRTVTVDVEDAGEPVPNQRPVADAGGPYVVGVDQPITFDGTGSTDADGDDLTYEWFVDHLPIGTGPTLTVGLDEPGEHVVHLVVHDGKERSVSHGSAFTTFTVTDEASDTTPPTVDLRTPADGATFVVGEDVTVDYECADDVAVASCEGTVPDGSALDTSEPGLHELSVTATDAAGNSTTATASYRVAYRFDGFRPPIRNDRVNVVQGGRTVPVKWRLSSEAGPVDDRGAIVSLTTQPVDCSTGELRGRPTPVADVDDIRSQGNGQWHVNWRVPSRGWTCLQLTLTLADGTTRTADFRLARR